MSCLMQHSGIIFFLFWTPPGFFSHFRAKSTYYKTATGRSRVVHVLLHVVNSVCTSFSEKQKNSTLPAADTQYYADDTCKAADNLSASYEA